MELPFEGANRSARRFGNRAFGSLRRTLAFILVAALPCNACSPTSGDVGGGRSSAMATPAAPPNHSSGNIMNRNLADRFPGAVLLGQEGFASAIVGKTFRYREVDSNATVDRPKEVFVEGGQYRIHWLRSISYGTYSLKHGAVVIDCPDCPYTFLDLGSERIFFRHEGRLLTANARLDGIVFELIEEL
jgi:hypothetical protein